MWDLGLQISTKIAVVRAKKFGQVFLLAENLCGLYCRLQYWTKMFGKNFSCNNLEVTLVITDFMTSSSILEEGGSIISERKKFSRLL